MPHPNRKSNILIVTSPPAVFARLGSRADIDLKLADAIAKGADARIDEDAGTIVVTLGGENVFRAIRKSADIWLVSYSTHFYSAAST